MSLAKVTNFLIMLALSICSSDYQSSCRHIYIDNCSLFYRYFAIFRPHKSVITPRRAWIAIALIWLVPMVIQTPWAVCYVHKPFAVRLDNHTITYVNTCYLHCSKEFHRGFFLGVVFLSCYLVPLCFITVCYSLIGIKVWKRSVAGIRGSKAERNIHRSKIRIVRMLITVALFFAFSWLPLYSLRLRDLFGEKISRSTYVTWLLPISQWMGSANSCVNPFVYCYFSVQFRRSIMAVVRGHDCCGKLHVSTKGGPTGSTTMTTVT